MKTAFDYLLRGGDVPGLNTRAEEQISPGDQMLSCGKQPFPARNDVRSGATATFRSTDGSHLLYSLAIVFGGAGSARGYLEFSRDCLAAQGVKQAQLPGSLGDESAAFTVGSTVIVLWCHGALWGGVRAMSARGTPPLLSDVYSAAKRQDGYMSGG